MNSHQMFAPQTQPSTAPLKESIRDMVRLQCDYQLSDELFWEVFDARVLHDEPIDINVFLSNQNAPLAQA